MTVLVDGVEIPEAAIAAEMQHHPAKDRQAAWDAAARALVVRTLLLAEARRRGLDALTEAEVAEMMAEEEEPPADEMPEERAIRRLIAVAVDPPPPDEAQMRARYLANSEQYRAPDLWEAQHILVAANPADAEATAAARAKAEGLLAKVKADPDSIGALARANSDCPSRTADGHLGQLTRGSTVPEFETFLAALEPGQVCPVLVHSRYGFHVLRLLKAAKGELLPFEHVRPRLMTELGAVAWRQAAAAFVAELARQARIEGLALPGAGLGDTALH